MKINMEEKMILIDALLPPDGKIIDMKVDEEKTVFEVLEDISEFIKNDIKESYVIATLRRGLLRPDVSLKSQGIHGGERIVIIPHKGGFYGTDD